VKSIRRRSSPPMPTACSRRSTIACRWSSVAPASKPGSTRRRPSTRSRPWPIHAPMTGCVSTRSRRASTKSPMTTPPCWSRLRRHIEN